MSFHTDPQVFVCATVVGGTARRIKSRGVLLLSLIAVIVVIGLRTLAPTASLPIDAMMVPSGWADERRCAECHEQAEEFHLTGHAQTLHRASEPELLQLLRTLSDAPAAVAEGVRLEERDGEIFAVHSSDGVEHSARIDWCFGSGHHARTWMGLLADSWGATDALEFRWTWFANPHRFDLTPGQPENVEPTYFGGLGVLYDYPKTRRCFGCHATQVVSVDGRLADDSLVPGVNCQRCHGPRERHLSTEQPEPHWSWRGVDQHESVHRCAECHRGADEQTAADIRPDNPDITRFQPVGLVQAPCFQKSSELTCVSCHDPHRPMELQDSLGDWQCVQCHDGKVDSRPLCGAGFGDDCLKCHMPKVQWSPTLQFTDHWIRIREQREAHP